MTLPEFSLIGRGDGGEAMNAHMSKVTAPITLSICYPPNSLVYSRQIEIPVRGLCQEKLSGSAASAKIHYCPFQKLWKQRMGKCTNGVSRNISDLVNNSSASPENLKPSAPVPVPQIRKDDSSEKAPRGGGHH